MTIPRIILSFASVHCGPPSIYFLVRPDALRLPRSLTCLALLEKQTDLVTTTLSNMALLTRGKYDMKADLNIQKSEALTPVGSVDSVGVFLPPTAFSFYLKEKKHSDTFQFQH